MCACGPLNIDSESTGALKMLPESTNKLSHEQGNGHSIEVLSTEASSEATEREALEIKLKVLAAQLETFVSDLSTRFPHDKEFIETLALKSMGLVRKTINEEAHFSCTDLHSSSSPSLTKRRVVVKDHLTGLSAPDHEHIDVQVLT